jgi:hypothetical protein
MSILFNRIAIIAISYCFLQDLVSLSLVNKGIGLHGGLLHITNITQIFHMFVFLISMLILQLTSFFPRKVWVKEHSSLKHILMNNFVYYRTKITNKMGDHLKIIEYPGLQHDNLLRGKLPNSGDILKLLIPNQVEFFQGGWTNYSRMVTSQKMALHYYWLKWTNGDMRVLDSYAVELQTRKMDNRGSKLNIQMFLKEQRVDGSYINLCIRDSMLRCTLKRFERISSSSFRLNQILNKQLHSTTVRNTDSKNLLEPKSSDKNTNIFSLNPWFITGFTDGDGSFSVSIAKKKSGTGWKIQPLFTIGLDPKDLDLLVQIKAYFKVGKIYTSARGIVYYTVGSTKDIIKYILPHFDKYNLVTLKNKDYLVFKNIVLLMEKGEHKSLSGLLKIFSLRAILNKGLPSFIKAEYPNITPAVEPELKLSNYLNSHWLSGFITAEGSFFISIYSNEKRKAGYAVSLVFSLSQDLRDLELLNRLVNYLGCGIVREHPNRNTAELIITKNEDINLKLIKFLIKFPLSGVKLLDFERFKQVSFLIENKMHLTQDGIELIKTIKDKMYTR